MVYHLVAPSPWSAQPALPIPSSCSALHLVLTRREQLRAMTRDHGGLEVGRGYALPRLPSTWAPGSPPLPLQGRPARTPWFVAIGLRQSACYQCGASVSPCLSARFRYASDRSDREPSAPPVPPKPHSTSRSSRAAPSVSTILKNMRRSTATAQQGARRCHEQPAPHSAAA